MRVRLRVFLSSMLIGALILSTWSTAQWAREVGLASVLAAAFDSNRTTSVPPQPPEDEPAAQQPHDEELEAPAPVDEADSQPAPPTAAGVIWPLSQPLPPGTALDISGQVPTPGQQFDYKVCTAAYSFSLPDGRRFAITAAHCGQIGDSVWAGSADGSFIYPADPMGTIVYSGLEPAGANLQLDIALVELVNIPEVIYTPQWIDAGLATQLSGYPPVLCKLGRITDYTCGDFVQDVSVTNLNTQSGTVEARAALAAICAKTGDSGGAVFGEVEGHQTVVGIVSGTTRSLGPEENCAQPQDLRLAFTPMTEVLAHLEVFLGTPIGGTL